MKFTGSSHDDEEWMTPHTKMQQSHIQLLSYFEDWAYRHMGRLGPVPLPKHTSKSYMDGNFPCVYNNSFTVMYPFLIYICRCVCTRVVYM